MIPRIKVDRRFKKNYNPWYVTWFDYLKLRKKTKKETLGRNTWRTLDFRNTNKEIMIENGELDSELSLNYCLW